MNNKTIESAGKRKLSTYDKHRMRLRRIRMSFYFLLGIIIAVLIGLIILS